MSQARRDLEKKARNAILQEAFFRWESAVTLAIVMVLAVIFPAYWWIFILLGLIVETGIGFSTMRNPKINAKAVAMIFEKEFQPKEIKSKELRSKTDKALEYFKEIEQAIAETKEGVLRDRLKRTTDEVLDWVNAIYILAGRIDAYRENQVIARDMVSVPKTISKLRQKLTTEDDPGVQQQLEKTIADKERQLNNLNQLENTIEKAELQLEQTLSALGTVYSQLLLVDSKGESSGRAQRLQEEISEQVHQLQDLTDAMDEIYSAE